MGEQQPSYLLLKRLHKIYLQISGFFLTPRLTRHNETNNAATYDIESIYNMEMTRTETLSSFMKLKGSGGTAFQFVC